MKIMGLMRAKAVDASTDPIEIYNIYRDIIGMITPNEGGAK